MNVRFEFHGTCSPSYTAKFKIFLNEEIHGSCFNLNKHSAKKYILSKEKKIIKNMFLFYFIIFIFIDCNHPLDKIKITSKFVSFHRLSIIKRLIYIRDNGIQPFLIDFNI